MSRTIIIDDDDRAMSNDYKAKAKKVIKELKEKLFQKIDDWGEDDEKHTKFFSKNSINAELQPQQVTILLNRLLRIYRPMNFDEALNVTDLEYLDAFGYYCDVVSYINKYVVYGMDKQMFSAFCNITVDIYNRLLENPNYTQVFMGFEDSFIQSNFSSAQAGIADTNAVLSKLQTRDAGHSLIRNPEIIAPKNMMVVDKVQISRKLNRWESLANKKIGGNKK